MQYVNHELPDVQGLFKKAEEPENKLPTSTGSSKKRVPEKHLLMLYWLCQKDLHDPDNHDDVITHLEPDLLESEVKWASGGITMNKASGGDGIPTELFQVLKDDTVKVLHSICQQIWKTQQWPQDWKRSVFIPMPRMLKLPHSCTHLTH